jgi:hypothetical protein
LECTTAGISGSGELTISGTSINQTITDGAVTWTVRKTLSTSLGVMDGSTIQLKNDNGVLSLIGASSANNGARAEFYGKDVTGYAGWFALFTANPTKGLFGTPDGQLLWNSNSLDKAAVVAFNPSANGYVKYASGLVIQWGYDGESWSARPVAFPISFTSWVSPLVIPETSTTDYSATIYSVSTTGFTVNITKNGIYPDNIGFYWIAIGY